MAAPEPQPPPSPGSSSAVVVSNAVVSLFRQYTGRGPTQVRTTIRDDVVVVILRDLLTKAEARLVEDGEGQLVLTIRERFQRTMREDLVSAVEDQLGRPVIGFMSGNQLHPDMACEVFVLAPEDADRKDGAPMHIA
jgi:uncharacterized protein YbcI